MKDQIFPCFWLDGQAKAAADFYCSLFKNAGISSETPMAVVFELEGKKMMGLNGGPIFKMNPSISLFVSGLPANEIDDLWEKLFEGGKALIPIGQYPWSERYGWLQDQFGLSWQLSIANDENPHLKIMPSMLFTSHQFGRAEEAINLYSHIFGNASTEVFVPYPEADPNAGKVMYSEFKLDDYELIAMDGPGVHEYTFNEGVSFVITCETQAQIDFYWEKLTDGGQESMCGWLKDKFGVSWQVVPAELGQLMADPEKGQLVIQAFLKMKKFDIEVLRNVK